MEKNINNIFIKLLIGVRFLWNVSMGLLLSLFLSVYNIIHFPHFILVLVFSGNLLLGMFLIFTTYKFLADFDKGYYQLGWTINNFILLLLFFVVLLILGIIKLW